MGFRGGIALSASVVTLIAAGPASAATRYAEPGGDGPEGSCPQADPCDIQVAIEGGSMASNVQPGDEIILLPGDYAVGSDEIDFLAQNLDVHGQDGQPRPRIVSSASSNALFVTSGSVRHLEVDESSGARALFVQDAVVEDVVAHADATAGFSACDTGNTVTIRDSVCWSEASGSLARGVGTSFTDGTHALTLRNVTAIDTGTGSSGIHAEAAGGADITIDAKGVIAEGAAADVSAHADGTSSAVGDLDHSNYATRSASADPGGTATVTDPTTANNQTSSPVFADASNGDFHQQASSPTIDEGALDASSGTTDIDGDARALDGDCDGTATADIGADELADCTAPQTTITSPPHGTTNDPTPTFKFSSDEAGSSFKCQVDGGPFSSCTSPKTIGPLAGGSHTFRVRATDPVGNTDASPDGETFTVDTTPPPSGGDKTAPDTEITKGPKKKVKTRKRKKKVKFEFDSNDPTATFECSLDDAAFEPCTSPDKEKVKKGRHSFAVRATDPAGNVDQSPDDLSFKVKRKK
jgi:hypothetical protein